VVKCLRCGRCCYYLDEDMYYPCKFLIKLGKKYFCRVYNNRLGRVNAVHKDGTKTVCMMREDSPYDFVGCPYNTGKQILDVLGELKDSK